MHRFLKGNKRDLASTFKKLHPFSWPIVPVLAEFHCIAGGFVPELWDLAMQEILKDDIYLYKVHQPYPSNQQLWEDFPIHQDKDAFLWNHCNKTDGAGLPPVTGEKLLDIDIVAQYTMHHGWLSSSNTTHGVAMNVALQADHQSVFGYSLGQALGPHSVSTRLDFMWVYGCVVALPGYYCKAIEAWNPSNPNNPFVECSDDTLTIQPYEDKKIPMLDMDGMVSHLIAMGSLPNGLIMPIPSVSTISITSPIYRLAHFTNYIAEWIKIISDNWRLLEYLQLYYSGTVGGAPPIMTLPTFNPWWPRRTKEQVSCVF